MCCNNNNNNNHNNNNNNNGGVSYPYWITNTRLNQKHLKRPLAAAIQSMHDLGTQHHSQLVLAATQFCVKRKTLEDIYINKIPHNYAQPGTEPSFQLWKAQTLKQLNGDF